MDIYSVSVDDVMQTNPKVTHSGTLAIDALTQIREQGVNCLPVLDGNRIVGLITWQQIVGAGIVA